MICLYFYFDISARQTSFNFDTTTSTSSFVVYLLNEKRTDGLLGLDPIAVKTCEPILDPELQALPPEAEIPAISRLKSNISAISISGKQTFKTVYKLFLESRSPFTEQPGICFWICSRISVFRLSIWI